MSTDVLKPGTILGANYRIVELIGEGGAGLVYKAEHKSLGHRVAIKVLFAHLARIDQIRQRFVEEAQIQAQLRHPNLVSVVDIIDEQELVAMVQEFIVGQTLDAFIRSNNPVDQSLGLKLAQGMLTGLGFAHRAGVIHRDIKPENVLLADIEGELVAKITDFGIAKILSADKRTRTGTKMGTVVYMAPEQIADSSTVDVRADIYSLGVTLYELFTGCVPFDSENVFTLMKMHQEAAVPDPRGFRRDLSRAIRAVILKALAKDPADRFSTAAEMAEALASIDPTAPPPLPAIALGLGVGGAVGVDSVKPVMPGDLRPAPAPGPPPVDQHDRPTLDLAADPDLAFDPTKPDGYRALSPKLPEPPPIPDRDTVGLELERRRPPRPRPVGQPFTSPQERIRPPSHARRYRVERLFRIALLVVLGLLIYQVFPVIQCINEASEAYTVATDNEAEFNPSGYSHLSEESARQVASSDGCSQAVIRGTGLCTTDSGFGHGHPSIFNVLLAFAAASAVLLFLIDRIGTISPFRSSAQPRELPPSRLPVDSAELTGERTSGARMRPSGAHRPAHRRGPRPGRHEPTLVGLKGAERQQIGRDLYLTLTASGFTPDLLSKIGVKVAMTCIGSDIVPIWPAGRPLSKLLSQIPPGETLALPFIVPWADAKKALEDGRKPIEIVDAIRVRVEYGDQRVEHRTRLTMG